MTAAEKPPPPIYSSYRICCLGPYLVFRSVQLCLLVISAEETDMKGYLVSRGKSVA